MNVTAITLEKAGKIETFTIGGTHELLRDSKGKRQTITKLEVNLLTGVPALHISAKGGLKLNYYGYPCSFVEAED